MKSAPFKYIYIYIYIKEEEKKVAQMCSSNTGLSCLFVWLVWILVVQTVEMCSVFTRSLTLCVMFECRERNNLFHQRGRLGNGSRHS